jgi:PAS domain S-box-containing protein
MERQRGIAGPILMRRSLTKPRATARKRHDTTSILFVGDSRDVRDPSLGHLQGTGLFRITTAQSSAEFRRLLAAEAFDLVVCELAPWGQEELHVLDEVHLREPHLGVVVLTSRGSERWAVEAMKRGAADYIPKTPGYLERLPKQLVAAAGQSRRSNTRKAAPPKDPRDSLVYGRILNALAVNVALLDQHGVIRAVNDAWKQQAFENHFQSAAHDVGVDYLRICDEGALQEIPGATKIAEGLRSVLAGERVSFAADYPCGEARHERWFRMVTAPVRDDDRRGAVVVHVDITHQKLAAAERERLFQQSLNLLCIVGFDGYMKRWNPAWCGVLGYSCEEMLSIPLAQILHPDDAPRAAGAIGQLLAGQDTSAIEVRILCKNGAYKWVLWNAVPSVDQGVFFATGQDITRRKQAEEQLRESQERFQLIATATKEAIWDWDLRENRLWRNESYIQSFGEPDVNGIIEWWRERMHPDDQDRIMALMPPPVREGQQKWQLEYRMRRVDGTYAHVYDRGFSIFDSEGEPVRMVGSIMDISELKNTEERLRESEERFRLASRATRDAIWDWDLRRGAVWRSEGFQSLFGYRPAEITDDLAWWTERIHPDDRERVVAGIPDPSHSKSRQSSLEYRFRRADGTYADVFERGFVMLDADGQPTRMIGTLMDISERRRAEEAAHLHQAELAHIARVSTMGEIATGLAHELNQPLTAIANYAESCAQAIASGAAGREEKLVSWIDKIAVNTHRAGHMIRRLRGFTRKGEPRRSTVEINELVGEVLELLEAETRLQKVRLRWTPTQPAHATVDRIQVQQVLVNLLRNAYEAMAANPPQQRQVTISATAAKDKVEIAVEDRGEGIAPENFDHIFDAFFTSKPNGVGIGLAISRSIVEDHGGRLWVCQNPKQGVTFHFTLPLSGA